MTTIHHERSGTVKAIAHRPRDSDPMIETDQCVVFPGRGLDSENRPAGKREVTLLSHAAWRQACAELRADLPWHTRRANLLIDGLDLAAAIGKVLVVGGARLMIHGETRPCRIMDHLHPGLREALAPQARGGVYGQVITGGAIRIGDGVFFETDPRAGTAQEPHA